MVKPLRYSIRDSIDSNCLIICAPVFSFSLFRIEGNILGDYFTMITCINDVLYEKYINV